MTLDNDLLTLWLRAGDLTREEVRALVEDSQKTRNVVGEIKRAFREYVESCAPVSDEEFT